MKRGRGPSESLTGGTGDVSPQQLVQTIVLSAANTFTQAESGIPVVRLPTRKGKSIVMEILRVRVLHPPLDTQPAAGGTSALSVIQLGTISLGATDQTNVRNILFSENQWRGAFTAAGTFESFAPLDRDYDMTDGAGHGVLVATDSIFTGATTAGWTAAATFVLRIIYRFKEVSLEEYIGIVQSQQ